MKKILGMGNALTDILLQIDSDEVLVFDSIPDKIWEEILNKNFSGNLNYAKRVILDNQDKINLIDYLSLDREKHNIDNFELTKNTIMEYINENKKIVAKLF